MFLEEISTYCNSLNACLTKLDISTEVDEASHMIVMTTKETYVFDDEADADRLIDEARQNPGYMESKKKFKQGKINKNGEIVRPDQFIVVIKLGH